MAGEAVLSVTEWTHTSDYMCTGSKSNLLVEDVTTDGELEEEDTNKLSATSTVDIRSDVCWAGSRRDQSAV